VPSRRCPTGWIVAGAVLLRGWGATPSLGQERASTPAPLDTAALSHRLAAIESFGATGGVLLLQHDEVVFARGLGYADREAEAPVTRRTPFELGSLSKQFTATAVLRLEIEGRLRRTDTVDRFFPDAPADKRGITVEQLLTHTSGLPYLQGISLDAHMSRAELARRVLALPLDFAPGARWSYSNYGYTLLGLILEKAAGAPFETVLRRELFDPAGMRETGFVGDSVPWKDWTTHAYTAGTDEGPLAANREGSSALGAGSVVSTLEDMGRWAKALDRGTVLPAAWRDTLMAPRVPAQQGFQYAYGWNVARLPDGARAIMHDGDIGGYNASMRWYPAEDLWLVVLSNARGAASGWRDPIVFALRDPPGYEDPPLRRSLSPESLRRVAGTFAMDGGGEVVLEASDGSLVARTLDREAIRALSATTGPLLAVADTLGTRALRIGAGFARGSADSVMASLHPSIPRERAAEALGGFVASIPEQLGDPVRARLMGATASGPGAGDAYLLLAGTRDSLGVVLSWRSGAVISLRPSGVEGVSFDLAPVSDSAFVVYDPFSRRRADVLVRARDEEGRATRLELAGSTAVRVPGVSRAGHGDEPAPAARSGGRAHGDGGMGAPRAREPRGHERMAR
jgi:CubicO group peptidase (beta-lactamase class C family)